MSINQTNIIDVISTSPEGIVILTISDHHSWQETYHHQLLQDKINGYLQFIEGGQIYKDYPQALNGDISIRTIMKYEPNIETLNFLEQCKKIINAAGIGFEWQTLK